MDKWLFVGTYSRASYEITGGSVNHILNYDIHTGELVENHGGQGMYEGSSWSRGQGWAGIIAAAGMMEIANHVPEFEKSIYVNGVYKILKATGEKYAEWSDDYDGVIKNGMERYYGHNGGVPMNLIYGDFYFADALYNLKEYLEK